MTEKNKAEIVLQVVCDYFGQDVNRVKSPKRDRELADCRKAFAFIARRVTRCSSSILGGLIGKDHSTVLIASDRAQDLIEFNGFGEHTDAIERDARLRIMKFRPIYKEDYSNFGQI